jgi:predicted metalloprotease with PDZ domain
MRTAISSTFTPGWSFTRFCADSYLGDDGGFITPAGLFMHVAGRLKDPVTVTVLPHPDWKQISTGLDPVAGRPDTFTAPNFDTLYDCPILIGNQEVLTFEAAGGDFDVKAKVSTVESAATPGSSR